MDIGRIKLLAKQGESNSLEFKVSTAKLQSAFTTICAFLNGRGGTVLIGVNDKGLLVGQDVTDNTRREIAREIGKIEPAVSIDVSYIEIKEKKFVIVIHVNPGDHVPYVYDGRAYQRNESQTDRMSQHRYEQLLVKRGQLNHSWEEFVADDYNISMLNQEEIYRTVMDGIAEKRIHASIAKESIDKILRQLELLDDGQLKRAAVVLFGKEIKLGYTQCWLKMARFKGTTQIGDFIDHRQIHCNVFQMLEEADNFLQKHLPVASYFRSDQFKRIDKPALPMLAVREALVNSICHRNYLDRSGYISLAIFDDRVEIWNNGTLSNKLTFEDLKRKHDSVLRNKLIARVFYLRGYIEAWGTGTIRMISLCREEGIPVPRFAERTGGFVVTFKFANHMGGMYEGTNKLELTRRQQEIINLLEKSELNSSQIAEKLKDSPSVRMIQIDLKKLENAGLIKREGETRSTKWKAAK